MARRLAHSAVWIVLAVAAGPLAAEIIPRSGPTSGLYHVDRWGCARIRCYHVAPSVQALLAAHRMKWVRVEIKACDPDSFDSDHPVVTEISDVVPLETNALKTEVRLAPGRPTEGRRLQVVVLVENPTSEAVTLRLFDHAVTAQLWAPGRTPASPAGVTYLRRTHPDRGEAVSIAPGEKFPFLFVLEEGLAAGPYELVAWVSVESAGRSIPSDPARLEFDVIPREERDPAPEARLLRHVIEPLEDGYEFRGRIAVESSSVGVPTVDYEGGGIAVAHVRGFDRDGREIEMQRLELKPPVRDDEALWRLREAPAGGFVTLERFRVHSRFAERPVDRLLVEVITAEGLVPVPLPPFRDTHFREPPPFGPETAGVRMRIRAERPRFRRGETLRFFMQAVATGERPADWRKPWGHHGSFGENTEVSIDGKRIPSPTDRATFHGGPGESWFTLPEEIAPGSGAHTLTFIVTSLGLKSNGARFEIE